MAINLNFRIFQKPANFASLTIRVGSTSLLLISSFVILMLQKKGTKTPQMSDFQLSKLLFSQHASICIVLLDTVT